MEMGEIEQPSVVQRTYKDVQKAKRKRAAPFTPLERRLLLHLVNKYKDVLDSKKSDTATILNKKLTWEQLSREFCAEPYTCSRPAGKLKKYWENVKNGAKDGVTTVKSRRRADGRAAMVNEIPPEAELLCAMIPNQMHSLDNPYYSDAGVENQTKNCDLAIKAEAIIDDNSNSNSPFPEVVHTCDEDSTPCTVSPSTEAQRSFTMQDSGDTSSKRWSISEKNKEQSQQYLLELEHEERLLRMRLLCKQLETEEMNYKIATRKLQLMEEEHHNRVTLLKAQIAHLDYSNDTARADHVDSSY